MLVRTREAAVCAIAYSPALLDLPKISFEATPVTASVGGKIEIPNNERTNCHLRKVSAVCPGKFVLKFETRRCDV